MLKRKSLSEYRNLLSLNKSKKKKKNDIKIFSITKKSFLYIVFRKVRTGKTFCTKCKK